MRAPTGTFRSGSEYRSPHPAETKPKSRASLQSRPRSNSPKLTYQSSFTPVMRPIQHACASAAAAKAVRDDDLTAGSLSGAFWKAVCRSRRTDCLLGDRCCVPPLQCGGEGAVASDGGQWPQDEVGGAVDRLSDPGDVLEGDRADLLSRPGRAVVRSTVFGAGAGAVEFGGGGGNEVGRGRPAPGRQRDLWLVRGGEQRRQRGGEQPDDHERDDECTTTGRCATW